MDTGDSERERFPLLLLRDGEPGFADHVGKALRLGELADRLDEVLRGGGEIDLGGQVRTRARDDRWGGGGGKGGREGRTDLVRVTI